MATKTVYITVRLKISNEKVDTITEEDVENVISNTDYTFNDVGDFQIETEIY